MNFDDLQTDIIEIEKDLQLLQQQEINCLKSVLTLMKNNWDGLSFNVQIDKSKFDFGDTPIDKFDFSNILSPKLVERNQNVNSSSVYKQKLKNVYKN